MATATATRKTASKPAPASARKNGKATVTRKAAASPSPSTRRQGVHRQGSAAEAAEADQAKQMPPRRRPPKDGVNFEAKAIRNRIVKEKRGRIDHQEIAEGLAPAEHRSRFRVSKCGARRPTPASANRPRRK